MIINQQPLYLSSFHLNFLTNTYSGTKPLFYKGRNINLIQCLQQTRMTNGKNQSFNEGNLLLTHIK
jgi:hypothetical protein